MKPGEGERSEKTVSVIFLYGYHHASCLQSKTILSFGQFKGTISCIDMLGILRWWPGKGCSKFCVFRLVGMFFEDCEVCDLRKALLLLSKLWERSCFSSHTSFYYIMHSFRANHSTKLFFPISFPSTPTGSQELCWSRLVESYGSIFGGARDEFRPSWQRPFISEYSSLNFMVVLERWLAQKILDLHHSPYPLGILRMLDHSS